MYKDIKIKQYLILADTQTQTLTYIYTPTHPKQKKTTHTHKPPPHKHTHTYTTLIRIHTKLSCFSERGIELNEELLKGTTAAEATGGSFKMWPGLSKANQG